MIKERGRKRLGRAAQILALGVCLMACTTHETKPVASSIPEPVRLASDPFDATYEIEKERIRLVGGTARTRAAAGSMTRAQTRVFGEIVYGDLDGDGDEDAVLWLVRQPGGSGSFYYLAAALNKSGGYQGSRAIFLGDRIAPEDLAIENGVVVAGYAVRRLSEPMARPPTLSKTTHLILGDAGLIDVSAATPGEKILPGWLVVGHEVRAFRPCNQDEEMWLTGTSPALADLVGAHREVLANARPYMPLFVTIAGRRVAVSSQGFGADYGQALAATRLLRAWPKGNCKSDRIYETLPAGAG